MVKVSIIVPIFNVEKFLKRSIESIQNQTLREIEIILVNDGSTDNSLEICDEFKDLDNRIILINQPNSGVSAARNAGLEVANGEYIGFVDPDDWIDLRMFESLYQQAITLDSEVCMCNFQIENQTTSIPIKFDIDEDIIEGLEISQKIVANMIGPKDLNSGSGTIMGSIWRLIVNKNFVKENDFKFKNDVPLMEDLLFCVDILLKSKRVGVNAGIFYHYVQNENSAVRMYRNDMYEKQLEVFKELEKQIKDSEAFVLLKERLSNRYINMTISTIVNEVNEENKKNYNDKIKFILEICEAERLQNIFKVINIKGYTMRRKIVLFAMRHKLARFLYLYYKGLTKFVS